MSVDHQIPQVGHLKEPKLASLGPVAVQLFPEVGLVSHRTILAADSASFALVVVSLRGVGEVAR